MEGYTVGKSQSLLESPGAIREFKSSKVETPKLPVQGEKDFATTLKDAVSDVNNLQKVSDTKMQQMATGQTNNIPEVMMAVEKADIALKLMVSVRNKMIDAYQEIMRMQV